jgi:hypothetical protein
MEHPMDQRLFRPLSSTIFLVTCLLLIFTSNPAQAAAGSPQFQTRLHPRVTHDQPSLALTKDARVPDLAAPGGDCGVAIADALGPKVGNKDQRVRSQLVAAAWRQPGPMLASIGGPCTHNPSEASDAEKLAPPGCAPHFLKTENGVGATYRSGNANVTLKTDHGVGATLRISDCDADPGSSISATS